VTPSFWAVSSRQRDDLDVERVRSDLVRTRERPVPTNELAVSAHQRRWGDEKGGPTLAREKSCERRKYGPISGGAPRTRHLALWYRELMTKNRDLDVLLVWVWTDPNESEQHSNEQEGD
jgi:hypothetical protein